MKAIKSIKVADEYFKPRYGNEKTEESTLHENVWMSMCLGVALIEWGERECDPYSTVY